MVALDRDGGRAVVVLGDTTAGVEPVARTLLFGTPPSDGGAGLLAWVPVAVAALFSLLALRRALREGALLPIADGLLTAVFGLVLLWNRGPWASVGGWVWGLVLAPAAAALVLAVLRGRDLPLRPPGRAVTAWAGLGLSAALVAVAVWAG